VYSRPTYEWAEIKLQHPHESKFSPHNVITRFVCTSVYIVAVTLVCSAIPFFGDFVALVGSFAFIPMDFIVPVLMYLWVKKPTFWVKAVNWFMVVAYSIVAVLGVVGAFRYIVLNAIKYKAFANL
jgi:hypothetical protein